MRPSGATVWRAMPLTAAAPVLAGCGGSSSALDPSGPAAERIAVLWWVMVALAAAVYAVFLVLLVRAVRSSRRTGRAEVAGSAGDAGDGADDGSGHRLIIGGGVVLPLVVLVPIAVLTMRTGDQIAFRGDPDHVAIEVTAHQFWWEVRYPQHDAVTANEIHIPVGRTVDLTLRSRDVIHSFWVPSLGGKIDNIPGQTTMLNLEAREAGTYRGFCAEYCGIQHANMQFLVVAEPEADFRAWVSRQAGGRAPPAGSDAAEGERVFGDVGCGACHTVRGTDAAGAAGPDLTHFGSRRTIGAATVENNRGNLGGWIADPQSIKPGARMPPTPLTGEQLRALVAYVEGLD